MYDVAFAMLAAGDPAAAARLADKLRQPMIPERESWGTDPDSVAAYAEAERIAGGPAPMREGSEP